MKKILYLLLITWLVQGCIPTRKLTYLQDDGKKTRKAATEDYRFKKGDQIYIDIKTRDKDLNEILSANKTGNTNNINGQNLYFSSYTVDKEGNIELPLLGKLKAAGLTAEQVKEKILDRLTATQIRNRQDVYIKVLPAGIFVTVLGEVGSTGSVYLFRQNPTLLEALAQSGDIKMTGNRRDVMIIRTLEDGTRQVAHLDLTKRSAMNSPYFFLKNNDVIYVRPLPQKSIGTGTTLIQTLTTLMSITSFALSLYLISRK